MTSDGTSLYAVSGNTDGATYWQGGNGVFKFQPGPIFTNESIDYFAPSQWLKYDQDDIDLCGSEPVVVDLPGTSAATFLSTRSLLSMAWPCIAPICTPYT